MKVEPLRSQLGRVRGLGSGKTGVSSWIEERVSSVALGLLAPWFVYSVGFTLEPGFVGFVAWLRQPLNTVLMLLFVSASLHHMHLGMRVIIEDYIHKHSTKTLLLLVNAFVCAVLAVIGVFAILKISLGA